MGKNNFYVYAGGGVQIIPCSVWDAVFQDLDRDNEHLCVAGSNSDFNEIWFFFPTESASVGYPDKVAIYNILDGVWTTENIPRSFWIDRNVLGKPLAITVGGTVYAHEDGYDDDGSPLLPRMLSGYFYIEEGGSCVVVDQMIPDFRWGVFGGSDNAQISITLQYVDTPGEDPVTSGPYLVTKATKFVTLDPAIRARQIAVEISSADTGSFWRIGLLRFRWGEAGRVMGAAEVMS
jgi:hypothetical protein